MRAPASMDMRFLSHHLRNRVLALEEDGTDLKLTRLYGPVLGLLVG